MGYVKTEFEEIALEFKPAIIKAAAEGCLLVGNSYYDELSQIGLISLWEAYSNFNIERDVKLSTYAINHIRLKIKTEVSKIIKERNNWSWKEVRTNSKEAVEEEREKNPYFKQQMVYLNSKVKTETEHQLEIIDTLVDKMDVEKEIVTQHTMKDLEDALEKELNGVEKKIYGSFLYPEESNTEMYSELGIPKTTYYRIRKRVKEKVKNKLLKGPTV